MSLDPGVPQITFWSDVLLSDGCTAPDAGACTPLQWLTVALRDVYEVDATGRRVPQVGSPRQRGCITVFTCLRVCLGVFLCKGSGCAATSLTRPVPDCLQRSGADVLNLTSMEWEPRDTQAGSPAVPVAEAALRAPFLAALPPCPSGGGIDPDASGGVAFTAQLFGGDTNLTYGNSSQELLAGNLRWSVEVVQW